MELHTLKNPNFTRKNRKRVGRGPGSGTGKTSGKGHKGAQARSGYARRYTFEGGQMPLSRRLPKRGFHHDKRWPMLIVNLDNLERAFEDGAEVTAETIGKAGLGKEARGGVKVLGRGEITRKLAIRVNAISPSAREKIEAAGGSVELIGGAPEPGAGGGKKARPQSRAAREAGNAASDQGRE